MRKTSILAALALSAMLSALQAQEYRYQPFSRAGTPALRELAVGSRLDGLFEGYGNAWCAWATSTLPAEGKPPPKPASFKEPDDEWAYLQALAEWETMYAADRVFDGNLETAWCEGSTGSGPGEAVALPIDPGSIYVIFTGYGRSKDVWLKNARPKEVLLTVLEAGAQPGATQHGTFLGDLRAIAQAKRTLADSFDFQELKLPEAAFREGYPYILVIEILTVYPGSKYKDCLISEIRVAGQSKWGMQGFGPD